MGQRILTDASGRRWDVADERSGGGLRFSHPPDGPSYDVRSERRVDELKDDELMRMLDDARERAGEEPVGRAGNGGSRDGGY